MAFNSHVVKQVEPKCHKFFAKQKFTFSKIYYIVHTIYILYTDTQTHTHTHTSFSTTLDKDLRKNNREETENWKT